MTKKILVGAAVVAMAVGLATAPSHAGAPVPSEGSLVITPDPVYQGGSTVITPADDSDSVCEGWDSPALEGPFDQLATVRLEVVDPEEETIVDTSFVTDAMGDWSFEVTELTTLGEYTVTAICDSPITSTTIDGFDAATQPPFVYAIGTFEVIAQAATTTTTTAAPTTSTSAAAAAVTATPAYTG